MRRRGKTSALSAIVVIVLIIAYFLMQDKLPGSNSSSRNENDAIEAPGSMVVEFLDVGQADCALIYTDNAAMLIDGGNNPDGELVARFIKEQGIDKLDYVIATHAHEDHIGGLDVVLDEIEVDHIMMPLLETTTKTYYDLLDAVEYSNAEVLMPEVGDTYELDCALWQVVSCHAQDEDNLNESSIVIRLVHGDVSLLFTGDAEIVNELDMMVSDCELESDILKVGHHGSSTSSCEEFVAVVDPEVAVISCGKDNSYGHPHWETVETFENAGIEMRRTDLEGTIRVVSNSRNYTVDSYETNTDGE